MKRLFRLLFLLGAMTLLVAISSKPAMALSYCCDACVTAEDQFPVQCPGGAGQSDYCHGMAFFVPHCWRFCSDSLCSSPGDPFCDHYIFYNGFYFDICNN